MAPSLISLRQQPNFFSSETRRYLPFLLAFGLILFSQAYKSGDFFEDGSKFHFVPEQCSATRKPGEQCLIGGIELPAS
ncbi:MAG: hypothetical protein R2773_02105 [Flavobacteriaceae bacterium]